MADRFKMIASGYAFFIRDASILLSLRKNTGYMDGFYSLPAGHIEDGESITKGTIREIKEEVGIELPEHQIQLVHVMHRKSNDIRMDFFFLVNSVSERIENKEPEKCGGLLWATIDSLPDNTIPYIRYAIKGYQNGLWYSEFGWE